MHDAARQLDSVARTSRLLLLVQRAAMFLTVALGAAVALGAMDFLLRLPGWLRLIIGVGIMGLAGAWLVVHLGRAWRFRPPMADLALRAERMYPQLAGSLASAVEFHQHADLYADPQRTGSLAAAAVARTQNHLAGVDLRRLIDPTPTLRLAIVLLASGVVATGLALAAGEASRIAAARWLLPLGETQWPRWTLLADLGDGGGEGAVLPVDEPVHLRAMVRRGHRSGMRVAADYRILDGEGRPVGPWQQTLLNAEPATGAGHPYGAMLEVPAEVRESLRSGRATAAGIEYRLTAGDDQTPTRRLTLVARPEVTAANATLSPPTYAQGLRNAKRVNLLDAAGDVAGADGLAGSAVTLELEFNKAVPLNASVAASVLPGLADVRGVRAEIVRDSESASPQGMASGVRLTFPLIQPVETTIALTDRHGLRANSDRRFRFVPVEDRPPSVAVVDPAADTSVTARAVVAVEAVATDDVGVEAVGIEAHHPLPEPSRAEDTTGTTQVASVSDRRESLAASGSLDLATLPLRAGDTVELYATARDVYELAGREHDPIRSTPRRLRIIGDDELIADVRRDLNNVQQAANRIEGQQNDLRDADDRTAAELQKRQAAIGRRIAAQEEVAAELEARVEQNRVDDPALKETIEDAQRLLGEAREASDAAESALDEAAQAREEAEKLSDEQQRQAQQQRADAAKQRVKQQQADASRALRELSDRLGAGSDAWALEGKAKELLDRQKELEDDAAELLPKTAGQRPEDLAPQDREALDDLANRQEQVADEARDLVRDMKEAGERMKGSERDAERVAAESMKNAAETAEREDLENKMREASESARENQLSQAQSEQSQASQALEQMLSQMGNEQREQQRQEMLKRRLVELAQLLEALLRDQKASLESTRTAQGEAAIKPLAPGQSALRQRTMAAEESAKATPETADAAAAVGEAVADQGTAVASLREADKAAAAPAQEAAVTHLEAALAAVNKEQEQQQQDESNQKRQELQKQYAELAKRQDELREGVEGLISGGRLTRLTRAKLRPLGESQETLRADAQTLGEESKDTLVFQQMHRRIDEAAARAAGELQRGEADASLAIDQRRVAATLRAMAAALEEAQADQEFENPPGQPQEGEGGGGGGQPPPLVPPVAELKLLRQVQELVYLTTRELHDASVAEPGGPTPAQVERAADLATQQRELHDLGRQMIEKMQQNAGPQ